MSSAGDSDATTQPLSSRPRHSGRKPLGSRTAMIRAWSMRTSENAPCSDGRTVTSAPARSVPCSTISRASSSAMRSLSLPIVPGSIPAASASVSVLVRLPLWPRAKWTPPASRNTGWALRQVLAPVVE